MATKEEREKLEIEITDNLWVVASAERDIENKLRTIWSLISHVTDEEDKAFFYSTTQYDCHFADALYSHTVTTFSEYNTDVSEAWINYQVYEEYVLPSVFQALDNFNYRYYGGVNIDHDTELDALVVMTPDAFDAYKDEFEESNLELICMYAEESDRRIN